MSATVKDLKECLEQFDDDVEVYILMKVGVLNQIA